MKARFFKFLAAIPALAFGAATAFANEAAPAAIKDPAEGWWHLWDELMIDITIIGVIFALITAYLLIKFKRKSPDEEGTGAALSPLASLGWVLIPVFVFMADDIFLAAKNFELYQTYRNVPANAYVVDVEGQMWSWNVKYAEGIETTNEMRVPVGKPIKVNMTSKDAIHSLFLPDFRVKWDLMPGRTTYLWFYPKKTGEFVMTCAEYCGAGHSNMMWGKVIVMPEAEFAAWVEQNKKKEVVEEVKKEEGGAI